MPGLKGTAFRGADAFHGSGGPLHVMDLRSPNRYSPSFVEAGLQAGFPLNEDFNGAEQEGVGLYQVTHRAGGEPLLTRHAPRGRQRADVPRHVEHEPAVRDEVVGIAQPVALDVRPAGVRRIRPPVVTLRGKVVRAARAARVDRRRDAPRLGLQGGLGHVDNPGTLERGEVKVGERQHGGDDAYLAGPPGERLPNGESDSEP